MGHYGRVNYRQLDANELIATARRLRDRVHARFPSAGLTGVAGELVQVVEQHATTSAGIVRPHWGWRLTSFGLLAAGVASLVMLFADARLRVVDWSLDSAVQLLDAGLSTLFFLGAGAAFAASLELRSRRRRCLQALHELRVLAHIIDLHQLTKDPDRALHPHADTPASPERTLTPFELGRYLDYCSEMLSLLGKLGALYAQTFPDPEAIDAVDDIEDLTTGLSRKIWQKIMVLNQARGGATT